MRERPIIFNARDVCAILDGKKTQTRRVVKLNAAGRATLGGRNWHLGDHECTTACPFGQPADRLWVRETWAHYQCLRQLIRPFDGYSYTDVDDGRAAYKEDGYSSTDELRATLMGWGYVEDVLIKGDKFLSPVAMPRWASRILLEITEVRVHRLRDISEDDARAEGFFSSDGAPDVCGMPTEMIVEARNEFMHSWDSTAKPGALWKDNPWVWAVSFKRVQP